MDIAVESKGELYEAKICLGVLGFNNISLHLRSAIRIYGCLETIYGIHNELNELRTFREISDI